MKSLVCSSALALALLALAAPSARAVTINVLYDPTDPRSQSSFTAAEQTVIGQAAADWQAALPGASNTIDITFIKSDPGLFVSLTGHTGIATDYVGDMGTDLSSGRELGTPLSATVLINATFTFFIDGTPALDEEFGAVAGAPSTFLMGTSGSAATDWDLLSTATHEIAHALGFTVSYQNFWMNVTTSPNPADFNRWVYAFAGTPFLGDPVADYNSTAVPGLPNGAVFLLAPNLEQEAFMSAGRPSHVDDVGGAGVAAGYFPYDTMNPGLGAGERRRIAFVDQDVLCDAFYACATVPEPGSLALGLLSVIALALRARGPRELPTGS